MRDGIEGDLVRIHVRLAVQLRGVPGTVFTRPFAGLVGQLFNGLRTRARHGLVTGGKDALHTKRLMQRIQRHQRDGRGAVRIGDDAFVVLHIRSVDFRHHQRDVRVLAEEGGIVHHHGTGFHRMRGKVTRDATTRAEQRDVDALEGIRGQLLNGDVRAFELQLLPGAACGGKEGKLADGKLALFQAADHLRAHSACGSDDGDILQGAHGILLTRGWFKGAAIVRPHPPDARAGKQGVKPPRIFLLLFLILLPGCPTSSSNSYSNSSSIKTIRHIPRFEPTSRPLSIKSSSSSIPPLSCNLRPLPKNSRLDFV